MLSADGFRASGVLIGLAMLLAAGCGETATSTTSNPTAPVDDAPSACSTEAVGRVVTDFLAGAAAGDTSVVDRYVSRSSFVWYSVNPGPGERLDATARDRSSLAAYLTERSDVAEVYTLVSMTVAEDPATEVGHLTFFLERRADDLPGGPLLIQGKGALACEEGKLVVWSIGGEAAVTRAEAVAVCGEPPADGSPHVCTSAG